jgi:hypothetical protein
LPEVIDLEDYAGIVGHAITDVAIGVNIGTLWYQVHVKGGQWLPKVRGYNINDSKNGYAGNFAGYKVYSSNNVFHKRTISFSSVVATDEITVAGVKFTFVASIGSTAGNVLKGANDAAALANLAAAINGASGAGTTYVEVSAADRAKLKNVKANLDASTGVLTTAGAVVVSTPDTTITVGNAEEHAILCRPGAIDLIMQQNIDVRKTPLPKQKADYYIISCLYGKKTFTE